MCCDRNSITAEAIWADCRRYANPVFFFDLTVDFGGIPDKNWHQESPDIIFSQFPPISGPESPSMKSTPIRTLLFFAVVFCAAPSSGSAAMIFVDLNDDGTGSRDVNSGVYANSDWSDEFKISWEITENAGIYTYVYTLSNLSGDDLSKEISNFIVQVSDTFKEDNILDGPDATIGPDDFGSDGNSSPGIPQDFYGLKFDFGDGNPTYTLVTDRAPVWGSFYTKDGKGGDGTGTDGKFLYAFNEGFTGTSTRPELGETDFTNWIPTPDTLTTITTTHMPEPASVLMLGFGGLALVGYGWRRRRNLHVAA